MVNIIGKQINLELSNYLKEWIDINDKSAIAEKTGVHFSTVNNIIYRKTNITIDNKKVLHELLKTASEKCKVKIVQSKRTKKELEKYLMHE